MDDNQIPEVGMGAAGSEPQKAMQQVIEIVGRVLPIEIIPSIDGHSFCSRGSRKDGSQGILAIVGNLTEDPVIVLYVEIARASEGFRMCAEVLFKQLAALSDKCRVVTPVHWRDSGQTSLRIELRIQPVRMSLGRAGAFITELKNLDALAGTLQSELPAQRDDANLARTFQNVPEYVEPVFPLETPDPPPELTRWARETVDFLTGASCVAVSSPFPIVESLALAALARVGSDLNMALGRLVPPCISTKLLTEVARKARGVVSLPVVRLSLGTSPYELANEVQAMLASLASALCPVVFTGSMEQLRAVFHGGQGGTNDPLSPIIRHAPNVGMELLVRFAVRSTGRAYHGIPAASEERLIAEILDGLHGRREAEQKRILPAVVNRTIHAWSRGSKTAATPVASFASKVSELSETLGGLTHKPRTERSSIVQERYTHVLTDPALLSHLQERLMAQDWALEQLVSRLRTECLTRPLHQPCRYCAQGTPATGKSDSAVLLAQRLGIPYVNIDAASIPDYYTAAAQLLGSGRGIVGSHQSGRLEQAAKHHTGALIEVSDLDHANERVRSAIADLFLQVLETGEAQSATGAMFSCANLIFAFTINLPDGMDETLRRGLGFNHCLSRPEATARVASEIKRLLSSAFLSRVGTPILFEPLDDQAFGAILERAVRAAILAASERLQLNVGEILLQDGLGETVVSRMKTNIAAFGARALLEHGRSLAADAVLEMLSCDASAFGQPLSVTTSADGRLAIKPVQSNIMEHIHDNSSVSYPQAR